MAVVLEDILVCLWALSACTLHFYSLRASYQCNLGSTCRSSLWEFFLCLFFQGTSVYPSSHQPIFANLNRNGRRRATLWMNYHSYFLYFLSNRRLWRCCEWRKNSEKSWSNLYQGNSDRWIQRVEMTVKLLLFEISIWRNCLSIGCLKWLQLHNWFWPRGPFLERPDNFSGPQSCFM